MKNVTIKDIAKVAGVSYATVSRALSGSSDVSADTRARILEICRDMGYTANYVARSMVMKRTKLIGLILPNIDNPFMSELAYHMEIRAREQGYNLMLCNSSHDLTLEREAFSLLMGRQVDGIILVPSTCESYENLKPYIAKMPTVFTDEDLRDQPETYVAVDNYRGARMGTQYLHSLGHRRILYLGPRKNSTAHELRAQGYLDACGELGMEPVLCSGSFTRSTIQAGYLLAKEIFQKPLVQSAVFAATDLLALGVMQAAEEARVRIPEDISLLGFDNIVYSNLPKINLTTIEQPKKTMACITVDVLLEKIGDPGAGYSHRILMPSLVERGTCARADARV